MRVNRNPVIAVEVKVRLPQKAPETTLKQRLRATLDYLQVGL